LAEKDAALIELGREVFGKHFVSADTYARALKAFGERDLVDLVDLMGQHAADEVLLIAFDQQLIPLGQKRLLQIPCRAKSIVNSKIGGCVIGNFSDETTSNLRFPIETVATAGVLPGPAGRNHTLCKCGEIRWR